MTPAADHHELIRAALARTTAASSTAERARLVGVSYSTMWRWVDAAARKVDPPVPLSDDTLKALIGFLDGDGGTSEPAMPAAVVYREVARSLRAQAAEWDRKAAAAERGGG